MGVSERIAAERVEAIGSQVGYSIRLETKRSAATRLLAVTTGVLLRRLQCDPDLDTVSHVFVDEVPPPGPRPPSLASPPARPPAPVPAPALPLAD